MLQVTGFRAFVKVVNGSSLKRRATTLGRGTFKLFEMLNSELTAEECDATEAI
jgi:hypothetical protein